MDWSCIFCVWIGVVIGAISTFLLAFWFGGRKP